MPAESAFSTRPGENSSTMVMRTWRSSTTSTRSPTLSAFQPNWVTMNAGVLLSFTTRSRENSTSSGRTGLPEWNVRPSRTLKVMVLPSPLTVWLSATPPASRCRFSGSNIMIRS